VYSASVNASAAAAKWEKGAPHPHARIEALKVISALGIETRVRIDPIIPIEGWREEYAEVLRRVADAGARRVTLGTLRGLQRTVNFARKLGYDTSWTQYLSVNTGWGKKMPDEKKEGGVRVLHRYIKELRLQEGRRDLQGDRGDGRRVRDEREEDVQLRLVKKSGRMGESEVW